MKLLILILSIFISLSSYAYNSGYKTYEIGYYGEQIECSLWYPTDNKSEKQRILIYEINSKKNAKISEKIKGIVILSHGFGGSMYGLHYLAESLSSDGFAVLAVSYPDIKGLKSENIHMFPPFMRAELSRMAFIQLKSSGWLKPDAFKSVYSAGFSMGGYTALSNMGAKATFAHLDSYCNSPDNFPLLCSPKNSAKLHSLPISTINTPIENIKAAVLLAPALGALYDKSSFTSKIPVDVFIAEEDSMIYGAYDAKYIASLIPNARAFNVKGADHSVFGAPCSDRAKKLMPDRCDEDGIDKKSVQKMISKETVRLFNSMK